MRFSNSYQGMCIRVITYLLLTLFLCGCGDVPPQHVTNSNLQVSSEVHCPMANAQPWPNETSDYLVLSTNSSDSGTVQSIRDYVSNSSSLNALPSSLVRKKAGHTSSDDSEWGIGCGMILHITNMEAATIQISNIGVKLVKDTQKNEEQYSLIDVCPLMPILVENNCVVPAGGRGSGSYFVDVRLTNGKKDREYQGQMLFFNLTNTVPQDLTLGPRNAPDSSEDVYVSFSSSQNMIYSIIPEITLDTSNGKEIVDFPQLSNILVFANPEQFVCYQIQSDTLVKVPTEDNTYFHNNKGELCT